jgi:two-component system, OmpR family, response regulator ArlR
MGFKILVVEDEEKLARLVELELSYEGYAVTKAGDGVSGLELALTGGFDLVLLDIMLPGLNGMEVLRRLRRVCQLPVIMLTARDTVIDKVSGLDSGANDYVTKPFAIEELLARIRVLLRGSEPKEDETLCAMGVTLDLVRHTADCNGMPVELTKREFDLLHYLLKNKEIVVSRETLLENVWGFDYAGDTNVVDVYVRYLRAKIDDVFGIKLIYTVRGIGYVIKDGG